MRRAQLIQPAVASAVALALATAIGCNRAETREQTQRAAEEVKTVAARAGDTLSDGWLTTRIQAQYFADDEIKGRYIDVSTKDKVVTITGYVDSPASRERALQIARGTNGVRQVNDQLLIGQSPAAVERTQQPVATTGEQPAAAGPRPVDDAQVTSTIQSRFFLDPAIKARHIDVETRGGVVTLDGEVASEAERAQALLLAREAPGVQRVEDHLRVEAPIDAAGSGAPPASIRTPADDATVAGTVKSRLSADPQMKVIDVTVQDGVAQLQGTVATVAVRNRAVDVARQTEGVTQVIDRLRVTR
jgi:osmotically-inducible protein OsmY